MADNGGSQMDYEEHERTYDLFIKLVKYGTAATVIVLILMAIFLV
ncbi:MAG: aa3-type cytochrome c oxidase subunit IV [Hyphomicrobiales bacterium]|nr:aa3-type cytochrome c oxidase subunit IV [Hyphomicrobiales bacterium]